MSEADHRAQPCSPPSEYQSQKVMQAHVSPAGFPQGALLPLRLPEYVLGASERLSQMVNFFDVMPPAVARKELRTLRADLVTESAQVVAMQFTDKDHFVQPIVADVEGEFVIEWRVIPRQPANSPTPTPTPSALGAAAAMPPPPPPPPPTAAASPSHAFQWREAAAAAVSPPRFAPPAPDVVASAVGAAVQTAARAVLDAQATMKQPVDNSAPFVIPPPELNLTAKEARRRERVAAAEVGVVKKHTESKSGLTERVWRRPGFPTSAGHTGGRNRLPRHRPRNNKAKETICTPYPTADASLKRKCGTPGCTLDDFHDGAHSYERAQSPPGGGALTRNAWQEAA